jgi:hypothetical protein
METIRAPVFHLDPVGRGKQSAADTGVRRRRLATRAGHAATEEPMGRQHRCATRRRLSRAAASVQRPRRLPPGGTTLPGPPFTGTDARPSQRLARGRKPHSETRIADAPAHSPPCRQRDCCLRGTGGSGCVVSVRPGGSAEAVCPGRPYLRSPVVVVTGRPPSASVPGDVDQNGARRQNLRQRARCGVSRQVRRPLTAKARSRGLRPSVDRALCIGEGTFVEGLSLWLPSLV